jgi:hypothetical protein
VRDTANATSRRTLAIVMAGAITLWAIGFVIDGLPSDATHDRYWMLFVAPSMIGLMVGVITVPLLVWSWLPQQRGRRGHALLPAAEGVAQRNESVRVGDDLVNPADETRRVG